MYFPIKYSTNKCSQGLTQYYEERLSVQSCHNDKMSINVHSVVFLRFCVILLEYNRAM